MAVVELIHSQGFVKNAKKAEVHAQLLNRSLLVRSPPHCGRQYTLPTSPNAHHLRSPGEQYPLGLQFKKRPYKGHSHGLAHIYTLHVSCLPCKARPFVAQGQRTPEMAFYYTNHPTPSKMLTSERRAESCRLCRTGIVLETRCSPSFCPENPLVPPMIRIPSAAHVKKKQGRSTCCPDGLVRAPRQCLCSATSTSRVRGFAAAPGALYVPCRIFCCQPIISQICASDCRNAPALLMILPRS